MQYKNTKHIKNMRSKFLWILSLSIAIGIAGVNFSAQNTANANPNEKMLIDDKLPAHANMRILTVTGNGQEAIQTNLSTVNLAIEANASTAHAAQKDAAKRANAVVDFLRSQNVAKLKTSSINLAPRYEYEGNNNKQKLVGYVANNSVTFETTQERAGTILDETIRLGATRIDGITFRADAAIVQKAKNVAIAKAAKDAEQKAQAALAALNLNAQQIIYVAIDESMPNMPQPMMYSMAKLSVAADASVQSSPVAGGSEEIEAKVTLHIRY
jgi:uncharacterized protein